MGHWAISSSSRKQGGEKLEIEASRPDSQVVKVAVFPLKAIDLS